MKAGRADDSGVFDRFTPHLAKAAALVHPGLFHLSEKGLTFRSAIRLTPWTEVDVELELPSKNQTKPRRIRCSGVVVECRPAYLDGCYDVTLLFMELDRHSLSELTKYSRLQTHPAPQRGAAFASARV